MWRNGSASEETATARPQIATFRHDRPAPECRAGLSYSPVQDWTQFRSTRHIESRSLECSLLIQKEDYLLEQERDHQRGYFR